MKTLSNIRILANARVHQKSMNNDEFFVLSEKSDNNDITLTFSTRNIFLNLKES